MGGYKKLQLARLEFIVKQVYGFADSMPNDVKEKRSGCATVIIFARASAALLFLGRCELFMTLHNASKIFSALRGKRGLQRDMPLNNTSQTIKHPIFIHNDMSRALNVLDCKNLICD